MIGEYTEIFIRLLYKNGSEDDIYQLGGLFLKFPLRAGYNFVNNGIVS